MAVLVLKFIRYHTLCLFSHFEILVTTEAATVAAVLAEENRDTVTSPSRRKQRHHYISSHQFAVVGQVDDTGQSWLAGCL